MPHAPPDSLVFGAQGSRRSRADAGRARKLFGPASGASTHGSGRAAALGSPFLPGPSARRSGEDAARVAVRRQVTHLPRCEAAAGRPHDRGGVLTGATTIFAAS